MSSSYLPGTVAWAENQVTTFKSRRQIYENYALTLQNVLHQIVKRYAPDSIVQTRAKDVTSFAGKIWRKKGEFEDPVNQFTDLCGGRIITNNQDEVKAICSYIETHFDIDWSNSVDISQRLKPSEFGYRSVHYIISFKPGVFPNDAVITTIPESLYPNPENIYQVKAEIQVRTILEHSWADFSHKISYKRPFKMPFQWEREMAKMAAFLEEADSQFIRIQKGLKHYLGCYSAYMTVDQMKSEIEILENVLRHDLDNATLADEIARLSMGLSDWKKAADILKPFQNSRYLPAIRDYGDAICNLYDDFKHNSPDTAEKKEYMRGQKILEELLEKKPQDIGTLCILAGTYRDIDEKKAQKLYQRAFEIEPDNPYPLSYYLDYTVIEHKDLSFARSMQAIIKGAYQKSRDLADAGLEIPWSYFNMGKFSLLLEEPYDAISKYAKGCISSPNSWPVLLALRSLRTIKPMKDEIPGFDTVFKFVSLYLTIHFPEDARREGLFVPQVPGVQISTPVVIIAGGTDSSVEQKISIYSSLLHFGVKDFTGTIISGGTSAGICKIVGDIQKQYGDQFKSIGYIPAVLPPHVQRDIRYTILRPSDGQQFSLLEVIQYWEDIIGSGLSPKDVRLLGINGGRISAIEFRIALAFGAYVGVLHDSGSEASKILHDHDWNDSLYLIALPSDPQTIRAFLGSDNRKMVTPLREKLGRLIHHEYQEMVREKVKNDPNQVNLSDWNSLPEFLKESNFDQADHIFNKLRAIGYDIRESVDRDTEIHSFTPEEVEYLSEMEHGRWNVERLRDGWRYGPAKDIEKKISPFLVPWEKLSEEIKEYDRDAVRKIPKNLAKIGLEIWKENS